MNPMTDEPTPTPADDPADDEAQTVLDAKFAALRAAALPASQTMDKLRAALAPKTPSAVEKLMANQSDVFADLYRPVEMPDWSDMPEARAHRATEKTAEHLGDLVDAAMNTDRREKIMLALTVAGLLFAAIAAVTGIIALTR